MYLCICVFVLRLYLYVYLSIIDGEICFKELAHMTAGGGKSEICRTDWGPREEETLSLKSATWKQNCFLLRGFSLSS